MPYSEHKSPRKPGDPPLINVWGTAGEVGLLIAIPVVVLVYVGVKIDQKFGTTPLFIICGMMLAMVISIIAVARKIKQLS